MRPNFSGLGLVVLAFPKMWVIFCRKWKRKRQNVFFLAADKKWNKTTDIRPWPC